MPKVYAVA